MIDARWRVEHDREHDHGRQTTAGRAGSRNAVGGFVPPVPKPPTRRPYAWSAPVCACGLTDAGVPAPAPELPTVKGDEAEEDPLAWFQSLADT